MENTVQALIDKLQQIEDKTLPVWTEGCDCWGEWNTQIEVSKTEVLINRIK